MNTIDELIYTAVLSSNDSEKKQAREEIRRRAHEKGIFPASINNLYRAIGRGIISKSKHAGFTVPAINIRALTYDTARIIFQLIRKYNIGALIFEIARSEIGYTDQRPDEYVVAVLAAAIKEGHQGPVFIQGDHFQFSKSTFSQDPDGETKRIKDLIKEAILARIYNIDIDASTLVNLSNEDLDEQQRINYEITAQMTDYIRQLQPKGITISIGGEIDHIGGKNSTVASFEAFMDGYTSLVKDQGISKISVQTGSTHGGVPLPDGTMANIKIDFTVLRDIGKIAREKYGLGGAVQHGASTLPTAYFHKFVEAGALEVHLATEFQNIMYDNLPKNMSEEIDTWVKEHLKDEWEKGLSEEQFIYRMRKKAAGQFKERFWKLTDAEKKPVLDSLASEFSLLLAGLNVSDTKEFIDRYISYS